MYFFSPCDQVGECRVALQGSAYPVPTLYLPCTSTPTVRQIILRASSGHLAVANPHGPMRRRKETPPGLLLGRFGQLLRRATGYGLPYTSDVLFDLQPTSALQGSALWP